MPQTLTLEIDEAVPSLNKLLRMHWVARRKLLKQWEWLIFLEFWKQHGGATNYYRAEKAKVRITRFSHHLLDPDNLHGSAKIVLDALKKIGLIADDAPDRLWLICEQESGAPRTVISINPLPAGSELGRC